MTIRLGCMNWNYPEWVGPLYPPGTKKEAYLTQYARAFDVVEVDSSFYRTPDARTVERWNAATPAGFTFTLKLVRTITHEKCFVDCARELEAFVESARLLGPKLGPILIQTERALAPTRHAAALARFLEQLPKDLTWAIEFRNKGWYTAETNTLLKETGVAWTPMDGQANWIPLKTSLQLASRAPTGKCVYVRLLYHDHGAVTEFDREQIDRSADLALWAEVLSVLEVKVPVYVLVNNHYEGHSPSTVRKLQRLLHLPVVDPEELR